mgnify:CR=1 FL=1
MILVFHHGYFAVNNFTGPGYCAAIGLNNGLVTKTNTNYRYLAFCF